MRAGWDDAPLALEVDSVAEGSFLDREPPEIRGTGYVVDTLEAARTLLPGTAMIAVTFGQMRSYLDSYQTTIRRTVYVTSDVAVVSGGNVTPETASAILARQ